jgi:hypothetical protein
MSHGTWPTSQGPRGPTCFGSGVERHVSSVARSALARWSPSRWWGREPCPQDRLRRCAPMLTGCTGRLEDDWRDPGQQRPPVVLQPLWAPRHSRLSSSCRRTGFRGPGGAQHGVAGCSPRQPTRARAGGRAHPARRRQDLPLCDRRPLGHPRLDPDVGALVGAQLGAGYPESAHSPQEVRRSANCDRPRPPPSICTCAGQPPIPLLAKDNQRLTISSTTTADRRHRSTCRLPARASAAAAIGARARRTPRTTGRRPRAASAPRTCARRRSP